MLEEVLESIRRPSLRKTTEASIAANRKRFIDPTGVGVTLHTMQERPKLTKLLYSFLLGLDSKLELSNLYW